MQANPYASALGDRDPLEVMAEMPSRLRRLIDALSPEQIEHHSAPGKWNVREIVAHLADCEIAWAWRLRHVFEQERPTLAPFDQDAWARIYAGYSLPQARAAFEALREWNLVFLRALKPSDRERPAIHPERGAITLWTIAETAAGHDLHHLAGLESMVESLTGRAASA